MEPKPPPKVFISYSWTTPGHKEKIRIWAEELCHDGINVILDVWDLRHGNDVPAFMEKIGTDTSIQYVLIFSDSGYATKADQRSGGVGWESQIISSEMYNNIEQSKFIPIVCEKTHDGEPFLPVYLKGRFWIDFSSPEHHFKNWESLIRTLHGKPLHAKPAIGQPPAYITNDVRTPLPQATVEFRRLRHDLQEGKPTIRLARNRFIKAWIAELDRTRVRQPLSQEGLGEQIWNSLRSLQPFRDSFIEWVILEAEINPSGEFVDSLIPALEQLLELKSPPLELRTFNDHWLDAHRVFVYEVFLYVVAALVKVSAYDALRSVFTRRYLIPERERRPPSSFGGFEQFQGRSEALQVLAPEGKRLNSPAAEAIKQRANMVEIPFKDIMQADLITLMMASLSTDKSWYTQTLLYQPDGRPFPIFARAEDPHHFRCLVKITGIDDSKRMCNQIRAGLQRQGVGNWQDFFFAGGTFPAWMNLDRLTQA